MNAGEVVFYGYVLVVSGLIVLAVAVAVMMVDANRKPAGPHLSLDCLGKQNCGACDGCECDHHAAKAVHS